MTEFKVNGKECSVNLSMDTLEFTATSGKSESRKIALKDILAVNYMNKRCPCVRIHHVEKHTNKRLRARTLDLVGEENTCTKFTELLQIIVKDITRPKRLLVFLNPESGHKNGQKIYNSKVLPLFNLAGISGTLIVTKRAGETLELLANYDLSLIHGIVSVGGDGMFSECVNGLLSRLQKDSEGDMNDPEYDIKPSNIPIGIVPTGSGNYLVNYIHGTRDLETAVLKIILGDHHMSNVVSLHQGQKLTRYASLLVEFGLIGDMMHDCEKYRRLGPTRYSVVPIATLMKRKTVEVQVEYLPEERVKTPSPKSALKFSRQVSLPASQMTNRFFRQRMNSMPGDNASSKNTDWKKLDGSFVYGVDTYVVTQKEKQGNLVPRFADSALTMWLTDKCSLPKHIEQLTRLQKAKSGFLDFDFIRQVRTTRYRVKLSSAPATMDADGQRHLQKKYYINADGEAIQLDRPEFEVKLHHCAMPIYGKAEG